MSWWRPTVPLAEFERQGIVVTRQREALAHAHDELQAAEEHIRTLEAQLDLMTAEPELTAEQRKTLLESRCAHCGGAHARACPRVKRMRFRADGLSVYEIEFWPAGQWPEDQVVWPEGLS